MRPLSIVVSLAAVTVLAVVLWPDRRPPPAPAPAPADAGATAPRLDAGADVLGRAGPARLDLEGFRAAVDEARVLQTWQAGRRPPLDALANARLRRQVMIQALETRVVRHEAARRGLTVPPDRLRDALVNAARGRPHDAPVEPSPTLDADALEARLVARYQASAERVRRVVLDVLLGGLLAEALLDDVDEATLRAAWLRENTELVLDVVQVPRVPTPLEIDHAVKTEQAAITAYHRDHPRLFNTPERAAVERVLVRGDDDAARARAEALRGRVEAGEPFAEVAAEGEGREAARAGAFGAVTRKRVPEAFDAEEGGLTPVRREREGFAFYRVLGRNPAVKRALDDPRVQREAAAAVLRERDELPHARATAERVRQLLRTDPDGAALAALVERERLRRRRTEPFDLAGPELVPGIGLADALYAEVKSLTPARPITEVHPVRQHFVVARLVERREPEPKQWPEARAAFTERWRARMRPRMVDQWLTERLRDAPTWVSKRLGEVPLERLAPD